jgi:hypothetical protein
MLLFQVKIMIMYVSDVFSSNSYEHIQSML